MLLTSAAIVSGALVSRCSFPSPRQQLVGFEFDYPPPRRRAECLFPSGFPLPKGTIVMGTEAVDGEGVPLDFDLDEKGTKGSKVEVIVDEPQKPVALLLTSNEPTVFNVSWTPSTHIVAAAAVAFHDDPVHIAGLPKEVPRLTLGSSSECFDWPDFHSYPRLEAMRAAVQIFGLGLTTLVAPGKGEVVLRDTNLEKASLMTSPDMPPSSFAVRTRVEKQED